MQTQRATPVMKMQRPPNILTRIISAICWGFCLLTLRASWLWWQKGYTVAFADLSDELQMLQLSITHLIFLQPQYHAFPLTLFKTTWENCQQFFSMYFNFPATNSVSMNWKSNVFIQEASLCLKHAVTLLFCILQTLGLKCLLLLAALPLFILALLVGLSDGLMQRAIRTASLGRESAYLFHQFSKYSLQVIFLGVLLFLILPIRQHLSLSVLLLALLVGTATAQVVSRFKKYL